MQLFITQLRECQQNKLQRSLIFQISTYPKYVSKWLDFTDPTLKTRLYYIISHLKSQPQEAKTVGIMLSIQIKVGLNLGHLS